MLLGVLGSNRGCGRVLWGTPLYCQVLLGTTEYWGALGVTRSTGGNARYSGVLRDTVGYWEYWGEIRGTGGYSGVLWGNGGSLWYCYLLSY